MTRTAPHVVLLTLLCVALLLARVGGAHLHLCFDGSEPPASLHFNEVNHQAEHHTDSAHDDLDVSAVGDTITKSGLLNLDLPALLFVVLLLSLTTAQGRLAFAPRRQAGVAVPPFLRPPLRGPPAFASL